MDFRPFFRLAALIIASLEMSEKTTAEKTAEATLARAEQYGTFLNQDRPQGQQP